MFILSSCEQPIKYITVKKTETVDNVVNTREIIYVDKEIFIMNDVIEPIKEYDNYVTTESKVFGIVETGFEEIAFISGLFKKDDVVYFKIDELFYSQSNGVITEIDESDYPGIPPSEYVSFNSGKFKIEPFNYSGMDTSRVYNDSLVVAYKQIDGACMRGNDLLYSVCETFSTRLSGIYIWTVNSSGTSKIDALGDGRIW